MVEKQSDDGRLLFLRSRGAGAAASRILNRQVQRRRTGPVPLAGHLSMKRCRSCGFVLGVGPTFRRLKHIRSMGTILIASVFSENCS
jgi:hypothetical protein